MSNYNLQYRQYYEGMQNKNIKQYKPISDISSENLYTYGTNNKKKEGFFSGMINVFVNQLVIVIIVFMMIFYMKYTDGTFGKKYYTFLKRCVTESTINSEIYNRINNDEIKNIVDDTSSYLRILEKKISEFSSGF